MLSDHRALYRIETSHAGKLIGGKFLGFAQALDTLDACDEWVAEHGGYEALGITADDVIAYEVVSD